MNGTPSSLPAPASQLQLLSPLREGAGKRALVTGPVSYTHLTLPTKA